IAIGIGLALLLVVDGVIFNPTGFRARLQFLVGPASQDFANYSNDWVGRWYVLKDVVTYFPRYYPVVFAPLLLGGIIVAVRGSSGSRSRLAASFVPLFAAISFTVAFNCVARRT